MTLRLTAAAIALCLAAAAASAAEAAATGRPCTQADLAGTWSLDEVTAADPAVAAWHRANPVEYLRFDPEGAYDVVAGSSRMDAAAVGLALDRAPGHGSMMGIVMNDPGELVLMRNGEAFEAYMCAVEGPAMVWTETDGSPAIRRVQTRLP